MPALLDVNYHNFYGVLTVFPSEGGRQDHGGIEQLRHDGDNRCHEQFADTNGEHHELLPEHAVPDEH